MTLRLIVGLLLTGWSATVVAQVASDLVPADAGAQRARIDNIRQQRSAELDKEDAVCLTRFAATDCQNQVGVRRRQMLGDLKRQETSLNAVERQQRRAEQLLRTEQKAADSVQRQLEAKAAAEKNQSNDRQKTSDDKQRAHQQQAQPNGSNAPVAKSNRIPDAKVVQENREAYLEKQRALEERRQERDQRLLDHGKGAAPLPLRP